MSNYTIRNTHADDWVAVPNMGRVTYQELESMVDRGEVEEVIDPKSRTIYYRKA